MATEFNSNNLIVNSLSSDNDLKTNNLFVNQTATLSTININGAFNFGEGEPALEVTKDGVVLIGVLSAATISATQIEGFDKYDQSLNTTDNVIFGNVQVGEIEVTGSAIGAAAFGKGIDFEDGSVSGDYSFEQPIGFSNTTAATGTRANLGLDKTDNVEFYNVTVGNDLRVPALYSTDSVLIEGEVGIAFSNDDARDNTVTNLGLGPNNVVTFGSISLGNATVQPGETLTSSISSLIITINGQQYKLPLLPV